MKSRNRKHFDNQFPTGFNNTYKRDNCFSRIISHLILQHAQVHLSEVKYMK